MTILTKSARLLLAGIVAGPLMTACAGGRGESNGAHDVPQVSATRLRAELTAGDSPGRQEPFAVRKFEPCLGDRWIGNAVAYGCYRRGQAPGQKSPDEEEILEDLKLISQHWNLIRVYGADEDTRRILQAIDTHRLPLRVMLGIWLEPEAGRPEKREDNLKQVILGVELANRYPHIVAAVSVGNETQVFWSAHRMPDSTLIRYIRAVRHVVAVPVTTMDDYLYWNKPESHKVAEEVDFVATHIHPLWNGQALEHSIPWLDSVYRDIQRTHPERAIVIGETGWATDYDPGLTGPGEQGTLIKGDVGIAAQASYLSALDDWIDSTRVPTFLFEAFDEPWKGGGESSSPRHVEKHWGVLFEDRKPKGSFLETLKRRPKVPQCEAPGETRESPGRSRPSR